VIRKAVIVILTLGAAVTVAGHVVGMGGEGLVVSAESMGTAVCVTFARGQLDVARFDAENTLRGWGEVSGEMKNYNAMSQVERTYGVTFPFAIRRSGSFYFERYSGGPRPLDTLKLNVGCPSWFLLSALATYPTIAFIRGPARRRHRRRKEAARQLREQTERSNETGVPAVQLEVRQPMIRKAIIVVLTSATIGTAAAYGVGMGGAGFVICAESMGTAVFVASAMGQLDIAIFDAENTLDWQAEASFGLGCYKGESQVVRAYGNTFSYPLRRSGSFYFDWYSRGPRLLDSLKLNVGCPLWCLLSVLVAYPAVGFIRGPVRRWRRRRKGLCVKCGYNLTGLPEPRCPECGLEW